MLVTIQNGTRVKPALYVALDEEILVQLLGASNVTAQKFFHCNERPRIPLHVKTDMVAGTMTIRRARSIVTTLPGWYNCELRPHSKQPVTRGESWASFIVEANRDPHLLILPTHGWEADGKGGRRAIRDFSIAVNGQHYLRVPGWYDPSMDEINFDLPREWFNSDRAVRPTELIQGTLFDPVTPSSAEAAQAVEPTPLPTCPDGVELLCVTSAALREIIAHMVLAGYKVETRDGGVYVE